MRHAVLGIWWLAACGTTGGGPDAKPADADPLAFAPGAYQAEIRYTAYGIPHVLGASLADAAYGHGWAVAKDHVCTLADQFLKVRSERSATFGPGEGNVHLDEDFGWLGLRVRPFAEEGYLALPADLQHALVAYAAGYNRYLEDVGPGGLPAPCRDAAWVKPIDQIDVAMYLVHLGQFGSGYNLVREVGQAQPPGLRSAAPPPPPLDVLQPFAEPPNGSNGWALGRTLTEGGGGMLLSNTHFPDRGERQWHEIHLTVPGVLDMYGVSLVGVPMVNMGFNANIAWTHTVSNTPRFVVHQLELDPASPVTYRVGDALREMTSETYTVDVLQDDGTVQPVERTLWRSHLGPVFNAPIIGWTSANAYTWRDVNENNFAAMVQTWFGMNQAADLAEFEDAQRTHQGIPWVHTLYTDADGNAWYADSAATPNLSPAAEQAWVDYVAENFIAASFADFGVVVVDGTDPVNALVDDPGAARPGLVPFDRNPQLLRDDFVANANMNHWMANPAAPLEGYPLLYGDTGTPLLPRTRMNLLYLTETELGAGADGRWTLDELEAAALSAHASIAWLLREDVVARCEGVDTAEWLGQEVRVADACAVLSAWDGTYTLDAAGSVLWRELINAETLFTFDDLLDAGRLFGTPFDAADPVYTPRGLAPAPLDDDDPVLEALAIAVLSLQEAGVALDASNRDVQYRVRGGTRYPVSGGAYQDGPIAVATFLDGGDSTLLDRPGQTGALVNPNTGLTTDGYLVNNGNSWVMAMAFTDDGPVARAVLTYSQSEDPDGPHSADQSALYTEERMRPILYREADILADPDLEIVTLVRE
ncbi:MAG: acyl-homoserine-lactone acylase [Myxococcota bacterium]|jgi:acyl-homoserine-lactone acylase